MDSGFVVRERNCTRRTQRLYESSLCLGNGYLGMRSAFCEEHPDQTRLTLMAGLYDCQPNEEEELIPLPDVTALTLTADGAMVGPLADTARGYERTLNLKNGLLCYAYDHVPKGGEVCLSVSQRRFVSMADRHLAVFETVVRAHRQVEVSVTSSINAKLTVEGTQHSFEEERCVLPEDVLWYGGRAVVAGTPFRVTSQMRVFVNGEEKRGIQCYGTSRRVVSATVRLLLQEGEELRIVRYALFFCGHDSEWQDRDTVRDRMLSRLAETAGQDFDGLLALSEKMWAERWRRCDIRIAAANAAENRKVRQAMYHMMIMCPFADDRVSIAAKGLTGMGYAGHVFWDCEIFNLPFFTLTDPQAARRLCTYRFRTLDGARRKAKDYGFAGAMYPWESASCAGDEQSTAWKGFSADNTPRRVTCRDIEHHVVCDVAYGVDSYVRMTRDRDFLERYGYEILFETAKFWESRLEYVAERDRYEILQVTGPDEYKEYVDNDVFTNYMAAWNLKTAYDEAERLQREAPDRFAFFDQKLGLCNMMREIEKKLPKLYLPVANEKRLVPQNDTYLQLEQIDVAKYKYSGINRLIYRDYSLKQIGQRMVSKQADLIQLLVLMPDLFPADIVRRNFEFYEDKCLHDSSLSLSAYAIVAAMLGDAETAHRLFLGALDTDFGEAGAICAEGIHAANCGGIWQAVVFGFAGIRAEGDALRIAPVLPDGWSELSFNLCWSGAELTVTVTRESVRVESCNRVPVTVIVHGEKKTVIEQTILPMV